jgi:hypothetical protein
MKDVKETALERLSHVEDKVNDIITVFGMLGRAMNDLSLYGRCHFKLSEQGVEYIPFEKIIKDAEEKATQEAESGTPIEEVENVQS